MTSRFFLRTGPIDGGRSREVPRNICVLRCSVVVRSTLLGAIGDECPEADSGDTVSCCRAYVFTVGFGVAIVDRGGRDRRRSWGCGATHDKARRPREESPRPVGQSSMVGTPRPLDFARGKRGVRYVRGIGPLSERSLPLLQLRRERVGAGRPVDAAGVRSTPPARRRSAPATPPTLSTIGPEALAAAVRGTSAADVDVRTGCSAASAKSLVTGARAVLEQQRDATGPGRRRRVGDQDVGLGVRGAARLRPRPSPT